MESVKDQSWSLKGLETVRENRGSARLTVGEKMGSFSAASQNFDNYFSLFTPCMHV
jgi:hypothetical protein